MAKEPEKPKETLAVERVVFFSDAVVAIAITLLALDLKVEHVQGPIHFGDLAGMWRKWAAFLLSFLLIGAFWKVHHQFFRYIRRTDEKMMDHNFMWLLFIVTLPFATSLLSEGFGERLPMLVYAVNTLLITLFQNNIWDYACVRPHLMNEDVSPKLIREYRIACNVAMINALLAIALAFFYPWAAFILLFLRPVMIVLVGRWYMRKA